MSITKFAEIEQKRHGFMDKVTGSIIESNYHTFSFTRVAKGGVTLKHKHAFEQCNLILEGRMEVMIDNKTDLVEKGDFIIIPGDTLHQYTAVDDALMLEIFHPKFTPEMHAQMRKQAEAFSKTKTS